MSGAIAEPIGISALTLCVRASAGIGLSRPDPHVDELMREADRAMYDDKHMAAP
ncbi:MAG: hypothetical protein ACRDL0_05315 [Thermoleophilaceae bacterium]